MDLFVLDESLGYRLTIVANLLKRELNVELKREGIDVLAEQWVLLFRLAERGRLNQQELAQATWRDNASVTRSLLLLEKKQLIHRQQTNPDRRNRYLSLTPRGQAVLTRLVSCAQQALKQATLGITAEEVTLMNRLTQKMMQNLKD